MPVEARVLDTRGLKCPQPMLKLAVLSPEMKRGERLVIVGDCPTFERDIRSWCARLGRSLVKVDSSGEEISITIGF